MEPQTALKEINEMLAELVNDPCQTTQNLVAILTAAKLALEAVPELVRQQENLEANMRRAVQQLKDNRYWHAAAIVEAAVYGEEEDGV